MGDKRIYFHNLDAIRFVSAMAVLLVHGFFAWKDYFVKFRHTPEYTENLFSGNFKYFSQFVANMGIGVEVFFFISGFLITYILLAEKAKTGKISIGKFYLRRAFRIWPLYYLLIAMAPFIVSWMGTETPDYLSTALFYNNYEIIHNQEWHYPFTHFWSIAIEEQFYLIWPILIALTPIKKMKYVFCILILISIAFRLWIFEYLPTSWHISFNTFSRMDTLVIGASIALIHFYKPIKSKIHWSLIFLLILILIVALSLWPYNDYTSLMKAVFKKYLYLLLFGTITMHYILKETNQIRSKFQKIVAYLGKISYGIYLIHNIFLLILIKKILLNNRLDSWVLFWISYPLGVIILSIISYELFEKVFLKLKDKYAIIKTRKN